MPLYYVTLPSHARWLSYGIDVYLTLNRIYCWHCWNWPALFFRCREVQTRADHAPENAGQRTATTLHTVRRCIKDARCRKHL